MDTHINEKISCKAHTEYLKKQLGSKGFAVNILKKHLIISDRNRSYFGWLLWYFKILVILVWKKSTNLQQIFMQKTYFVRMLKCSNIHSFYH